MYLLNFLYRFGPLRHQWCMRFEGKNHQLKRLVGQNFKNVSKSVANRHQYQMCLEMMEGEKILQCNEKIGMGT